jgi:hypothetical protein
LTGSPFISKGGKMNNYEYVFINSETGEIHLKTTNFDAIPYEDLIKTGYTQVFRKQHNGDDYVGSLYSVAEYEEWRSKLEKNFAWSQKFVHAVTPSHYQNYIDDYQWIDAMSRLPTMKDPKSFQTALELQIRKYLDRNGKKDAPLQELKKARFYLQYLIMYIENDNQPILAKDVQKIFGDERC